MKQEKDGKERAAKYGTLLYELFARKETSNIREENIKKEKEQPQPQFVLSPAGQCAYERTALNQLL